MNADIYAMSWVTTFTSACLIFILTTSDTAADHTLKKFTRISNTHSGKKSETKHLRTSRLQNLLTRTKRRGYYSDIDNENGDSLTMKSFSWVEPFSKLNPEIADLINNPFSERLALIGSFLAAYKYFEIDQRYTFMSDDEAIKPKFFRHFPIPRLRKFHPAVKQACDKGVLPCVQEIYSVANKSKSTAKIHKNFYYGDRSIPDYHPLKSKLDLFRYRVTASYYMCWYTDMKSEILAFSAKEDCFHNLTLTTESKGKKIKDFRASYSGVFAGIVSPFTCSYLWFCPDPCYGKTTEGNVVNRKMALKETKNPCKAIHDPSCFWNSGKNTNFEDLIRNKFNYTCNCTSEREGFIWSPLYGICIDRDECYERIGKCPDDKVCRNTIGSYICTCRRGFRKDLVTDKCIKTQILRASVYKSIKVRTKKKQKSKALLYMEVLFGLSKCPRVLADKCSIFGLVFIVLGIVYMAN